MNVFDRYRSKQAAQHDAAAQVDSVEERLIAQLGPRPELDPVKNHTHARMVRALNQRADLAEGRRGVERLEEAKAEFPATALLLFGLVAAFMIEAFSGYLIMKSFELPGIERLPLGVACAAALFAFTAVFAAPNSPGEPPGMSPPPRSLARVLVVPLVYTALVVALAIARLRETDDEMSRPDRFAEALILTATGVGPAFISHYLLNRYVPLRRINRALALAQRRVARLEAEYHRAERFLTKFAERQSAWDQAASRWRAGYRTHHRLESAQPQALPTITVIDGDDHAQT